MSKAKASEKKGLVPRLRFPEFQDAVGWKRRKLSEVLSEHRLKSTGSEHVHSVSVHKGLINQILHLGRSFSANSTAHYNLVLPGDVVYTKSPTGEFPFGIVKRSKLDSQVIVSPLYGVFSPCTVALGIILDAYFESPENAKIYLEPLVQKGAKNTININNRKFLSGELTLPFDEREQQKIADCLSSLDSLIAAQVDKINVFKIQKKGLIQQLFPNDGDTVPRLRFPDFRGAVEWEHHKLEGMTKRGSGHTPDKKNPSYYNGGVKWVSLADSYNLDRGYLYQTKYEISKEGLENSSTVLHPRDTVILSRDAGVGKSAVLNSAMAVSQHFIAWRCDNSKLYHWFLYYSLQKLKPVFESVAVGNTIKTIGLPYFKEMKIYVPDEKEQQKIADCLSSLDALIVAHTEKLDALKAQKKGLMQQLFPSPNAR